MYCNKKQKFWDVEDFFKIIFIFEKYNYFSKNYLIEKMLEVKFMLFIFCKERKLSLLL